MYKHVAPSYRAIKGEEIREATYVDRKICLVELLRILMENESRILVK